MIEILQWSTLTVCGLVAIARVPSALRGKNRTVFYIFALMTLATLLSIRAPYFAIDQALGGVNVANLLLRFVIFAAIFFVGIRVTRGFGADSAYRLLTGRIGMAVLALTSLVVVIVFLMMDTTGSSAGMAALSSQSTRNVLLLEYYGAAGRAFPAYVAVVLLPAMVGAVRSSFPALVRIAASLLGVGSIAVALTLLFPFFPSDWGAAMFVINYSAILCFVFGLALIGIAGLVHGRGGRRQKTSTAN
ncbi:MULTISPECIES: hypothetical protein [unclassified Arthrobacter]|uniref:hypothetical protein n=1 Tax=unclassified Arthrobacter TaxID=235627 RepID=UPI003399AC35